MTWSQGAVSTKWAITSLPLGRETVYGVGSKGKTSSTGQTSIKSLHYWFIIHNLGGYEMETLRWHCAAITHSRGHPSYKPLRQLHRELMFLMMYPRVVCWLWTWNFTDLWGQVIFNFSFSLRQADILRKERSTRSPASRPCLSFSVLNTTGNRWKLGKGHMWKSGERSRWSGMTFTIEQVSGNGDEAAFKTVAQLSH